MKSIADKIFPFQSNAQVALLIGNNVPRVMRPREIVSGGEDEPYAQKSVLGWEIIGTVCRPSEQISSHAFVSNRISASLAASYPLQDLNSGLRSSKLANGNAKLVFVTKIKEVINPTDVKKMFELDFVDNKSSVTELWIEDRKFITILSESIQKGKDGCYSMPLPLKHGYLSLPNNRSLAVKRLAQLKRCFLKNQKFMKDYVEYMKEVLANWAERVPSENGISKAERNINYVPHTGVYHPRKPGKIRVVFDCSAKFGGVSLNDYLLTGPNLMNEMVGVLCRFRKEKVALAADVQSMFCQFLVEEKDRDLLRFLW